MNLSWECSFYFSGVLNSKKKIDSSHWQLYIYWSSLAIKINKKYLEDIKELRIFDKIGEHDSSRLNNQNIGWNKWAYDMTKWGPYYFPLFQESYLILSQQFFYLTFWWTFLPPTLVSSLSFGFWVWKLKKTRYSSAPSTRRLTRTQQYNCTSWSLSSKEKTFSGTKNICKLN